MVTVIIGRDEIQAVRSHRRSLEIVIGLMIVCLGSCLAHAQSPAVADLLRREFVARDFAVKSFGPVRWLKGAAWRKVIYGSVGVLSSKEQASALQTLEQTHHYIDPTRVAVWGRSGGGSNTLNLMFRHPEIYKVGMAVAPVPDQRLYDSIYQERYMGLPQDNADGYKSASAINFAEGLQGNLLLVHGSGDDNMHYQGTELLANRLIELGKPFDFMTYPGRTHSISEGSGTAYHLYSLLARYLEQHLPAEPGAH